MSNNDSIKRCPFCGNREVNVLRTPTGYYVTCRECGAFGPDAMTAPRAVRAWNVPMNVMENLQQSLRVVRREI